MLVCLGIKREDRPGGFPANAPDRTARATRKMTGTEAGRSIDTVSGPVPGAASETGTGSRSRSPDMTRMVAPGTGTRL
jgi:hypothetical protein